MSISLKRARAIFVKDYKEFSRNYAVSIMLIFPIIFAFLIRGAGPSLPGAFGFVLNCSFVILTSFAQSMLDRARKERNTLRSLMMTPATTMDVLIGKSTLVFVMSVVVLAIATYILGYEPASIWAFVAAIILSIILYTAAGTICGLFSKTLLEASLSIIPVAIVFTWHQWRNVTSGRFSDFQSDGLRTNIQLVHLLDIHNIRLYDGRFIKTPPHYFGMDGCINNYVCCFVSTTVKG